MAPGKSLYDELLDAVVRKQGELGVAPP